MKKFIVAIVIVLLGAVAFVYAQAPGYGHGWRGGYGPGPGWGYGMGPGMMWGYGSEYGPSVQGISIEQATEIAKQYTEKYLPAFTVERVLPFTGMRHTMYAVELKGPKGELRQLHVNPWGGVMPFAGGPWVAQ
jgi:hypothetical protein